MIDQNQRCPGCSGRVKILELPWGRSALPAEMIECGVAISEQPDTPDEIRGDHMRDQKIDDEIMRGKS